MVADPTVSAADQQFVLAGTRVRTVNTEMAEARSAWNCATACDAHTAGGNRNDNASSRRASGARARRIKPTDRSPLLGKPNRRGTGRPKKKLTQAGKAPRYGI
jgi:hypothetical protein